MLSTHWLCSRYSSPRSEASGATFSQRKYIRVDIVAFADFMRSTQAPSRGPINADVLSGEALFTKIGCAVCHIPALTTARPGTKINGGAFVVPDALGKKIIHPIAISCYTTSAGDGIPVLPTAEFAPRRIGCELLRGGHCGLVTVRCTMVCPSPSRTYSASCGTGGQRDQRM
jgi:hypothetical protein